MAGRAVTTVDPLASELRRRRLDLGLSTHMVGRAVGVSRRAVWMWENGQRTPDLLTVRRWVEALGLDLAALDPSPAQLRPHGTYAAACRHRHYGEALCGPCQTAERAYWRQRRQITRERQSMDSPARPDTNNGEAA